MRILSLVTDAFGGRGGIAQFNRDSLDAICALPGVTRVTAIPRLMPDAPGPLPPRLTFVQRAAGGKIAFVRTVLRIAAGESFDVVVCGHLNLLPLAVLVARYRRVPLVLVVYGIEAWERPDAITRFCLRWVSTVVSISEFTKERLMAWSGLAPEQVRVIPCAVDRTRFAPGARRDDLLERYALGGRVILLTVARLAGRERYKGIDEVLDVLPRLARAVPDIAYLVVGDGPDRARLERKAARLGVSERVVFAGYVEDHEKADHYRLADLFVMPGRGEGFGIVYLEAMASGVRVVASSADASRETVLDGRAGEVVDPGDPDDILAGILRGLSGGAPDHAAALERFSREALGRGWEALLACTASGASGPDGA